MLIKQRAAGCRQPKTALIAIAHWRAALRPAQGTLQVTATNAEALRAEIVRHSPFSDGLQTRLHVLAIANLAQDHGKLVAFQQVSIRLKKTEFNQVVDGDALQLAGRGSWFVVTPEELEVSQARVHNRELMITATLPGSGDWGSQRDALAFEQAAIAEETALQALLVREKVEAARRAMLLYPQQLSWNWWDDVTVELRFWLPAGSFATSVVRELINTTGDYANIAE